MDMELGHKIGVPWVVQWCILWLSAPTRLNRTLDKQDVSIRRYHEAVNMEITCAIPRPFGGEHAPTFACWHQWFRSYTQHSESGRVNKEMEEWEMGWSLEILPSVGDASKNGVMNDWNHPKPRPLSTQRPCTAYPFPLRVLHIKGEDCRKLKRRQQS